MSGIVRVFPYSPYYLCRQNIPPDPILTVEVSLSIGILHGVRVQGFWDLGLRAGLRV